MELKEHLDLNIPGQKTMIEWSLQLCAVVCYKIAFRTWVAVYQTLETNLSDVRCIMRLMNDGLMIMFP